MSDVSEIVGETIMTNPRPVMGVDVVERDSSALVTSPHFDPSEILIQVLQRPTDPLNQKLQECLYGWVAAGMAYQPIKDLFGGWIDVARNWQTKMFRKASNHKFLLMIDADVGPTVDIPILLRRHDLPVVSGVVCGYNAKRGGLFICVAPEGMDGKPRFITLKQHKTIPGTGLVEVARAGTGCLLIRRDVIENLWSRYEKDLADQEVSVASITDMLEAHATGTVATLTAEQRASTQAFLKRFNFKTDLFGAPFNIPQAVRDKAAEIGAMPYGEDIMFTHRVKAAGYKMYADLEARCTHDKVMTLAWPDDAIDHALDAADFVTSLYDTPVEMG